MVIIKEIDYKQIIQYLVDYYGKTYMQARIMFRSFSQNVIDAFLSDIIEIKKYYERA